MSTRRGSESSAVVKQGQVHTKSRRFGIKNTRWFVLFNACSLGPARLVKYADEKKATEEMPLSEITMQEVNSIVRAAGDDGARAISLHLIDRTLRQFTCDTEADAQDWLRCLHEVHNNVGRRDSLATGMFRVFLMPSATLNFFGECIVEITFDNIKIYSDNRMKRQIATWSLVSVRRFGNDQKNQRVLVEVGRSSESGEGVYLLRSFQHDEIHRTLENNTRALKTRLRNSSDLPTDQFYNNAPR